MSEGVGRQQAASSCSVENNEHAASELCSRSSVALEKVTELLKHLPGASASLAVPSASRAKGVTDPREMTLVTPRGSMRRSTFYDEDLGEVVDLSGHGTWANADLHEIIQDLVEALSPLQAMSKGHEERMATL